MTIYYYDTEFIENGSTIELISIGIINEHGEAYYAVNSDAPWDRVKDHDWLMKNVWPHLPIRGYREEMYTGAGGKVDVRLNPAGVIDNSNTSVRPEWVIANEVREFLTEDGELAELWADYGAYDHVVLMQLWGPMIRKPDGLPMYTHDIQQWADAMGLREQLPEHVGTAHDALSDAEHVKTQWEWLNAYPNDPDAEPAEGQSS